MKILYLWTNQFSLKIGKISFICTNTANTNGNIWNIVKHHIDFEIVILAQLFLDKCVLVIANDTASKAYET